MSNNRLAPNPFYLWPDYGVSDESDKRDTKSRQPSVDELLSWVGRVLVTDDPELCLLNLSLRIKVGYVD